MKSVRAIKFSFVLALAASPALAGCGAAAEYSDEEDFVDGGEFETQTQELSVESRTLWMPTGGTAHLSVPVCFENGTDSEKRMVQSWAEGWETFDPMTSQRMLDFTEWDACTAGAAGIHVKFAPSGGNFTTCLGADCNGVASGMNLQTPLSGYAIRHEFGHALGYAHEQDRDDDGNACTSGLGQTVPDLGVTAYDPNSIMNYCGPNNGYFTSADVTGHRGLYGGSLVSGGDTIGMRAYNRNFLRNNSSNDVIADAAWVRTHEKVRVYLASDLGSTSSLTWGAKVYLKTWNDRWIRGRSSAYNYDVDSTSTRGNENVWEVVYAGSSGWDKGGWVDVNETVALKSSNGRYLTLDSSGSIKAGSTSIGTAQKWLLLDVGKAIRLNL